MTDILLGAILVMVSSNFVLNFILAFMPNELRRPAGYGTSITLIFMGFAFAAFACFLVFLFGLGVASV